MEQPLVILTLETLEQLLTNTIRRELENVLPTPVEPRQQIKLHRMEEACKVLSVCRGTLYKIIKTGQLTTIRLGNRRLVTQSEIERFIETRGGPYFAKNK